ncbi:MAG TPA: Ig domain-containing protein [Streptosporangiaceae bacterium]
MTSGSDGSCGGSYLCGGEPGYDGPTGLGTPDGTGAFKAADNTVTVASPGPRLSYAGRKIIPVRLAGTDTLAGQHLSYSGADLPSGLTISKAGVISGTPARLQYATVTVTATDNTGASGTAKFAWDIAPAARERGVLP